MTNKTNVYLAMWDCYGLEYLTNLSKWSERATLAALKEEKPPPAPMIDALLLRARFNPQRNYEVYTFSVMDDVSEESLKEAFEKNPQFIVDHIREHGEMMWSDRINDSNKRVIT